MRKSSPLDALKSRTKQGILATTLLSPDQLWYLSALARHLGVSRSGLQRDLGALAAAGILTRWRDGNRTYYRANRDCPFLTDLRGLLAIARSRALRTAFVIKGGTTLRKLYFEDYRFSEDLDVSAVDAPTGQTLEVAIREMGPCAHLQP